VTDPREPYGRIVNDTRRAFATEHVEVDDRGRRRQFLIADWDERAPSQRELDMRIGSVVAAQAVADAKLRNERLEAQVFALRANRAAILDALEFKISWMETERQAKPYRAAWEALGGTEGQERTGEKGAAT
jgi:hypothetical protein